jgi:hypothetical protein
MICTPFSLVHSDDLRLRFLPVRVFVSEDSVEVRFAWWQKIVGLTRNISVSRSDVSEVHVVEQPMREAMRSGMKFGMRLPWIYYLARTIRLDQAFVVRRGQPGLSFAVDNASPLKRVLVSTPEAEQLARELGAPEAAEPDAAATAAPAGPPGG